MSLKKRNDSFKATDSIYDCCEQSKVTKSPEGALFVAIIATAIYDCLPRHNGTVSPHRIDALEWLFEDDQIDNPEPRRDSFRFVTELIFEDGAGFREKIRKLIIDAEDSKLESSLFSLGTQRRIRGRVLRNEGTKK